MPRSDSDDRLLWDQIDSPLGNLFVAAAPEGALRCVTYGVDLQEFMMEIEEMGAPERSPHALAPAMQQLETYFSGERRDFDVEVDLAGLTPFRQSVLRATQTIPYGEVWTYGDVAAAAGSPRAARAVGTALRHNPIGVIVPCHRVVAADGSIGGYSGRGGLTTKRFLLGLEGAQV